MGRTYRSSAGFGKRIEMYAIGLMLKEGMDVYVPLVDDHAVDAIYRRAEDGRIFLIQIKARSSDIKNLGDAALFSAIEHNEREDYWFLFYSEHMDRFWLMSSEEFLRECNTNVTGKNIGKRTIWFNGMKKGEAYCKPRFEKYLASDFNRLRTHEL